MLYRPVTITEFADIYQFGPSHMQWAARNSLAAHEDKGLENEDSTQALESFLLRVTDHIRLRSEVAAEENRPTNPLLVEADRKVDGTYSKFVKRIRSDRELYGPESERGKAATRMLDSPLGMPISAVTHVERIEQEALLKNIIQEVESRFSDELDTLELQSHFTLLKEQTNEFIELMSVDAAQPRLPSRTGLEEERRELQAQMCGCIFQILGAYPGVGQADMEMRTVLLGPFAIQNDRIAEYNRRKRGGGQIPPEVDEDTGEIIEDSEEPTTPQEPSTPEEDGEPTVDEDPEPTPT